MYDYLRHRIQLEYAAAWRAALSGLLAGLAFPVALWLSAFLLSRWLTAISGGLLWLASGGVVYLGLAGGLAALANQRVSRRNDFGLVSGAAVLFLSCVPLGMLLTQSIVGAGDAGFAAALRAMVTWDVVQYAVVPTFFAGVVLATAWAALLVPCVAWLSDADWQAVMDRMVNETYHRDWMVYNQNLIDQKKIAYYLKTGQEEKAAALEAGAAERAQRAPPRKTGNA